MAVAVVAAAAAPTAPMAATVEKAMVMLCSRLLHLKVDLERGRSGRRPDRKVAVQAHPVVMATCQGEWGEWVAAAEECFISSLPVVSSSAKLPFSMLVGVAVAAARMKAAMAMPVGVVADPAA